MNKIETKKLRIVNARTLIVAIDIGKLTPVGYCRCPDGRECKSFEFSNTVEGFKKLWDRVCWMKTAHHLEEVVVGFESTGPYGEPLVRYLKQKPVKLVQVNPFHTKRVKELEDNSPGKTDRKDPRVIADLIELGRVLSVVVPEGAAAELRRLTQARERKLQKRTASYNQLHALVFLLFPEFLRVMKDLRTQSAQYLLEHYPTAEAIRTCGLEQLRWVLRRVSRGKLGQDRAQTLFEAAKESVGLREGRRAMLLELEEILREINHANQFIQKVEKDMSQCLKQIPYSGSLLSLKGIGRVTVAGLIGEVGDFDQFHTLPEVMKLAGLTLYEISSGKHQGIRRISKRGRSFLRKLLYFAALNMVRKKGVMYTPYQRLLQRGMPRTKALVAIARKLLRILFALARDRSQYIQNYSPLKHLDRAA
jgi:transposase